MISFHLSKLTWKNKSVMAHLYESYWKILASKRNDRRMKLTKSGEEQPLVVIKVKTRGEIQISPRGEIQVLSYPTGSTLGEFQWQRAEPGGFFYLDLSSANLTLQNKRILKSNKNYVLQWEERTRRISFLAERCKTWILLCWKVFFY